MKINFTKLKCTFMQSYIIILNNYILNTKFSSNKYYDSDGICIQNVISMTCKKFIFQKKIYSWLEYSMSSLMMAMSCLLKYM